MRAPEMAGGAGPRWPWLGVAAALGLRAALIPCGLYRSTDFEVHRNWLAITHSLPLSRWYYEDSSEWTLDYPPLFAAFEWLLSQLAVFADPEMLRVQNLNYASPATVAFQRGTVILADLVLLAGAYRLGAAHGAASPSALLAVVTPGLLLVDHVHFQYNGMLLGLLMLSIADLEAGRMYRGAALFCMLLNMKHIFLYVAPVFFVYLLRGHCGCSFGGPRGVRLDIAALVKLGAVVLGAFAVAWAPIICTGQLAQSARRLFPFGRGLTHAYWAPNVWALYNTADRVLAKLGFGEQLGASSTAGFAEVYESSALWTVPPKATFVLTAAAYLPLSALIWRQMAPAGASNSSRAPWPGALSVYVALGCGVAFTFGWHVHEKAILMVTVPLLIVARGSHNKDLKQVAAALSAIGTFSVLPLLPQRHPETGIKWALGVGGHILELSMLREGGSASSLSLLRVGFVPGWLLVLGMASLGLYCDFGGHQMLFKGRMEFLPLMLISDFSSLVVLLCFCRLFLVAASAGVRGEAKKTS